ncbi:O-antigen ligase family protein [Adhaeribacter radiodurans]|uniref:O-antigen ligase family protein n=1 Tax=Adhaeribacter radiodurans TaxID=2745197 RepID=A0A7L7L8V9_9BACT|nr:O-antigen ligase family protein [Adhaeribacter radiodurans]QMU28955.1 O-antigen ligase family protein [Adhaeribacter radiodurans]
MILKFRNYKVLYEINLVIIALLLPFTEYFSIQFVSISIILLMLGWLLFNDKSRFFSLTKSEKLILFFFILSYLINLTSLFRGGSSIAEKVLIKKLALLLLPIIIATGPRLTLLQIKRIIFCFILSLVISTIPTYSIGINNLLSPQNDLNDLADILLIHRPYFGLFCAFSVIALLVLLKFKDNIYKKITSFLIIIYLLFFAGIIYAKMALIAFFLTVVLSGLVWLLNKRFYMYSILLAAILLVGGFLGYQKTPSIKYNISNVLAGKDFSFNEYNILVVGSINTRYVNWGCAFKVLNTDNNWLYGVGSGNSQNKLQECYKTRNLWVYESKMNSHNQFIEETLYNGIGGMLIFLCSLLLPGIISFKRGDFLHLSFLILFTLCCLTESILSRQVGIIFYSFFNSILFFNFKKNPESITLHE